MVHSLRPSQQFFKNLRENFKEEKVKHSCVEMVVIELSSAKLSVMEYMQDGIPATDLPTTWLGAVIKEYPLA